MWTLNVVDGGGGGGGCKKVYDRYYYKEYYKKLSIKNNPNICGLLKKHWATDNPSDPKTKDSISDLE